MRASNAEHKKPNVKNKPLSSTTVKVPVYSVSVEISGGIGRQS